MYIYIYIITYCLGEPVCLSHSFHEKNNPGPLVTLLKETVRTHLQSASPPALQAKGHIGETT